MSQTSAQDQIVQTTHFDFALARRIWKPFQTWSTLTLFVLDAAENLTRTTVDVWGDAGPDPHPCSSWGVNVDIGLLYPEDLKNGQHRQAHHLGHFSFIRIKNVEYNEENEYVQFNFHEMEGSSTGPHPRALRISRCGYVTFGGGMWDNK